MNFTGTATPGASAGTGTQLLPDVVHVNVPSAALGAPIPQSMPQIAQSPAVQLNVPSAAQGAPDTDQSPAVQLNVREATSGENSKPLMTTGMS